MLDLVRKKATSGVDRKAPRRAPQQERSAQTVSLLLDATGQVVASEGIALVTSEKIARRAGMSKGTLFQYFPTKDAIVAAWEERELTTEGARFMGLFAQLQSSGAPFRERVQSAVSLAVDILRRYAARYPGASLGDLLVSASARDTKRVDFLAVVEGLVTSALENSDARPQFLPTHLRAASILVVRAAALVTLSSVTGGAQLDDETLKRELAAMIGRYFVPDQDSSR